MESVSANESEISLQCIGDGEVDVYADPAFETLLWANILRAANLCAIPLCRPDQSSPSGCSCEWHKAGHNVGKVPMFKLSTERMPQSERQIEKNFGSGKVNVGSRLDNEVVFDFDRRNGGDPAWLINNLRVAELMWINTFTVETAGGIHVWFKSSGLAIKNSTGELAPGLDTKSGDRAIVTCPGSLHVSGFSYRQLSAVGPEAIQPLPISLRRVLLDAGLATAQRPKRSTSLRGHTPLRDVGEDLVEELLPQVGVAALRPSTAAPLWSALPKDPEVALGEDPEALQRVLDFLGLRAEAAKLVAKGSVSVCSPIIDTEGDGDENPSAGLLVTRGGGVVFRDFRGVLGHVVVALPDLFAVLVTRRLRPFERIVGDLSLVRGVWLGRLLIESGVVAWPNVPSLSRGVTRDIPRKLVDGIALLFAARWLVAPGTPIRLARHFVMDWTGLSERVVRDGLAKLKAAGAIVGRKIGNQRGLFYLPGKDMT